MRAVLRSASASSGVNARSACWTRLPSCDRTDDGTSVGRLGDEVHAHALGSDEPGGALDLVHQRVGRVVEQQVRLVEEEAQLGLRQVAGLGQGLVQLGEHPEHERREQPRLVHDVGQLEDADDALALGRRAQEVLDVELGLAEEDVGAFLLEHDDRPQQHPDRRRSTSRRTPRGSACPRPTTRNLSVVARSLRSSSGRSLSSQYLKTSARIEVWVSLRSSTLPSSSGPNELTVARTCAPSLPESDRNSTGWPVGSKGSPSDAIRSDDLRVGRVAGRRHAGRSPLMSATNTGTPASDSWPAISWRVLVLPVPVAPAISPWRLSMDSATCDLRRR